MASIERTKGCSWGSRGSSVGGSAGRFVLLTIPGCAGRIVRLSLRLGLDGHGLQGIGGWTKPF